MMLLRSSERGERHTVVAEDAEVKKLATSSAEWKRVVVNNRHLLEHLIY